MQESRYPLLLLVAPAVLLVLALFVYPLALSVTSAFSARDGTIGLANFIKTVELYGTDILFTLVIVGAQCMRTFLAKNGMLNNTLDTLGLIDSGQLSGLLDWRGIIVTFVWKETPFVALLVAGVMASLDRAPIEAARNLGASGPRILVEIILPQVSGAMLVGLILAFVTMLSVLSVPIMLSGGSPTMITVDMAFRVNSYGDYGVTNALGLVSYAITGLAAWAYMRRSMARAGPA